MCGGTVTSVPVGVKKSGLSPRVRGNLGLIYRDESRMGSIPACAGEPSAVSSAALASRVYPRVCGGTGKRLGKGLEREGLSPRVRGNRG